MVTDDKLPVPFLESVAKIGTAVLYYYPVE
jgi:hypothetical protein